MFLEIPKYINYKPVTIQEALNAGYVRIWGYLDIKKAFRFGNGCESDFKRYAKENKENAYFLEVLELD